MAATPSIHPTRRCGSAAATRLASTDLYGRLLATAAAGDAASVKAIVRREDGCTEPLPLEQWLLPADEADKAVLARTGSPIIDIGCGPGRHVAALHAAGDTALGLDIAPAAVAITSDRGAPAIMGSVFEYVPHAGAWRTALLLDGNIGIGGAPDALLRRVRELLAPGGQVIVELDPPGSPTDLRSIRLGHGDTVSEWFPWARVSVDGIEGVARSARLAVTWTHHAGGRWFAGMRAN